MSFSIEVEVVASVLLIHPGIRRFAQEQELSFQLPTTATHGQMETELNAFPETEFAFELFRGEAGGLLAADHVPVSCAIDEYLSN
jgi:hypothetical protein